MPRGESVHYVSAATGTAGHRPLPLADPDQPQRAAHAPQRKRSTGLDWDAITPRCKACGTKSGALNFADLCPTCAAPGTANDPTRLMRKTKPGECSECGRESRFLHDGECPLCRGETTERVLAHQPAPAKPPTANVASPPAQSSPPTPTPSATPRVDGLAELIRRVEGEHTPPTQLPVDHVARAALVLDLTRDTTGDAIAAMMRRAAIAALEALWLHWRLHHQDPRPAPDTSRDGTEGSAPAGPTGKGKPDKPSRPATIDRPLDETQLAAIAHAYHHDLVSIADLAITHQLTAARVRHIVTRDGQPIRGRGDLNRRITQTLANLGVTSHDVKTWAYNEGLTRGISRGTIAPAVLTAYVAAHPTNQKELSS